MNPPRLTSLIVASLVALPSLFAATRTGGSDTRPFKVVQTTDSIYPVWLASAGIMQGEVRALINVDADGKLADCLITGYTHPDFAREALSCLRSWEYQPARQNGSAVGMRAEMIFTFEAKGMVVSVNAIDLNTGQINRVVGHRLASSVASSHELDQPLELAKIVSPQHPGKLVEPAQPTGTAKIDFYVDEQGQPRMPVVLHASHELFARAAVQAIEQWKFSPPTRNGRPVCVHVVREFNFSP